MAASSGPDIVDSGLVLALDAADRNSFDDDENLFTYSEQFNDGAWISSYGQNAPATTNQIAAPDGTTTADLITFTPDGTGQSRKEQNTGTQSGTYTASIFVKNGTIGQISLFVTTSQFPYPNISYNFTTDTITNNGATGTRTLYPNGWVRITATATVTSHTMYSGLLSGATGTIYAWGAQLERGSSPSPYYPTTGTAKNRGSSLIDLTGRGNTGTLTNGPTYSSSNGGSLVFDGVDDYTSISNNTLLSFGTNSFTINLWIRRISTSSSTPIIATYNDYNAGYTTYFYAGIYNGTSGYDTGFTILTSFGNYITSLSAVPITNNEWINISVTRSGNNITLYRNGSFYSTASSSGNDWSGTGRPTLMGGGVANTTPFNGNISNVSVYNRALSAAEIQQNFNATRSRFGI